MIPLTGVRGRRREGDLGLDAVEAGVTGGDNLRSGFGGAPSPLSSTSRGVNGRSAFMGPVGFRVRVRHEGEYGTFGFV